MPVEKVRDYLLDPFHDEGGAKAGFFHRFGFERTRYETLRQALFSHPAVHPVHDSRLHPDGVIYRIQCALDCPDERSPCVRTVWLIRADGRPQFVTAVPA